MTRLMRKRLEEFFEFGRLGTNWRTEILAGATTFLTMAYIVLVNPAILGDAGVPVPRRRRRRASRRPSGRS